MTEAKKETIEPTVISIQHDVESLSLVIEALSKQPHGNIKVWPLLQVYLNAYQTMKKVETDGIEKVKEDLEAAKEAEVTEE